MNNQIQPFQFHNHPVRVEMIDDEPWFVAKDLCDLFEIRTYDAMARLEEDEKLTTIVSLSGQERKVWMVSESGMYNLIFTSRKPEAKEFRRWVTHEVLPAIRREGVYVAPPTSPALPESGNSLAIAKQLVNVAEEHEQRLSDLEQKVAEGVPMLFPAEPDSGVLFPRVQPSFMTIRAFARQIGESLTRSEALSAGCTIAQYCRQMDIWYDKRRHGNRYPVNILAEYFKG